MATTRKVSKKTRFEVFKRDSFTCQYCGLSSPEVVLHVDHVKPVAKGGSNRITNLVTSCQSCNSGKSDRQLSDMSVVDKCRRQSDELQERKNQIALMLEWQESLLDESDFEVDACEKLLIKLTAYDLSEIGRNNIRKLIKKFGFSEVLKAIPESCRSYLDDKKTRESVELCLSKLGGVCRMSQLEKKEPLLKDAYYVRGILRNRLRYVDESGLISRLVDCMQDIGVDAVKSHACESRNWSDFSNSIGLGF